MCDKYITCYEGKVGPAAAAPDTTDTANDNDDDFVAFSNISVTNCIRSRSSKLEKFLQKPVENVKDPFKWWVANQHVYPNLYYMALDYLSIPGRFLILNPCLYY